MKFSKNNRYEVISNYMDEETIEKIYYSLYAYIPQTEKINMEYFADIVLTNGFKKLIIRVWLDSDRELNEFLHNLRVFTYHGVINVEQIITYLLDIIDLLTGMMFDKVEIKGGEVKYCDNNILSL